MRDRRRLHNKTFSRAVSLLLGLLLCLEPLSVVALAVISEDVPAVKTEYKPTVVVEGNAVVTGVEEGETPTAEDLTGFFEVALKVQTAAYYDTSTNQRVSYEDYVEDQAKLAAAEEAGTSYDPKVEKKDDIGFGLVNATLQYDASIFTPVSWSATEDIFDSTGALRAGLTTADGLTDLSGMDSLGYANLDAIGPEEIIDGVALAYESVTAGQNILFMSAQVIHETVHYDQPTTVVVVRFAYNKNVRPMLTTDGDSKNYVLGAAGAERTTAANGMTDGWNGGGVNADAPEQPVLWLAEDGEAKDGPGEQSVWYDGNYYEAGTLTARETAYYYYIGAETDPASANEEVTYVAADGTTQTRTIPKPNTLGKKVLSLDYKATPAPDPSYLDNVLKQNGDYPSLVFQFVNAASFLTSGVNVDDVAPILFYDWDNTLLGVLVVEKGKDVRAEVNAFVSQWIHEEIIDAIPAPDVSSLARIDNYRGKYDYSGPAADPGNADTDPVTDDGEEYPLTNKLDYVFFKRPMEPVLGPDTDSDGEPDPIRNRWQQMSADDGTGTGTVTAEWDEEYPYVYGWASCVDKDGNPDPTMVEATWTTLGMGELSSYSGASSGGYKDIGTDPATVTYDSEEVTFTFADFKTGVEGPTYVKAVYEPGVDLMNSSYSYRMIKEPYYNKLNTASASYGGAYSVSMYFERALASDLTGGLLRGVARFREPYVRQDTTTDLRWEENADLGVDHDLPNATNNEAYVTRTKTTYTRVIMENAEEFEVALTLSARQNKVDYMLIEAYGDNFVSGGQRNTSNFGNINTTAFVVDNYNYYVSGQSNGEDDYYDVIKYTDREGSHGFVLYGTLNNLMQISTQCYLGELDSSKMFEYISVDNMLDINIRVDDQATHPDATHQLGLIDAMLAAAEAAEGLKTNAAYNCWNDDLNCAQLTYHQLQFFILDYLAGGSATLKTYSDAENTTISWCHLHADCAALSSGKPETWTELMEKAADAASQGDIALLTLNEIENLFRLRTNDTGGTWGSPEAFRDAVVLAVTRLTSYNTGMAATDLTWDMVQYAIINSTGTTAGTAAAEAAESYWWYDGATEDTVTSWTELVASAVDAVAGVATLPDSSTTEKIELPDGTVVTGRDAKLNRVLAAFEANAAVTDGTDPAWIAATHNLAKNSDGEKFDAFEKPATSGNDDTGVYFKDAVTDAVTAALAKGETEENITWEKIQYYILNKEIGYPLYPSETQDNEMKSYWWKDGGTKINDFQSLMTAAAANDTLRLGLLTADEITNVLNLRALFDGTEFSDPAKLVAKAASYLEELKTKNGLADLEAVVNGGYIDQDSFQYYLVRGSLPVTMSAATADAESYYWWLYNSARVTVNIATGDPDNLGTLLQAAYRAGVNGSAYAWSSTFTTTGITELRFYAGGDDNGDITDINGLPKFENLDTFKSKMEALARLIYTEVTDAATGEFIPKALDTSMLDWYTVQFYLIHDRLPADDADQTEMANYWWKDKDSSAEETVTPLDTLNDVMEQALVDGVTDLDLNSFMTVQNLGADGLSFIVKNGRKKYVVNDQYLSTAITNLEILLGNLAEDSTYWDSTNKKLLTRLTWYQYQYALLNGGDLENATTAFENADSSCVPPSWVTAAATGLMSLRPTVPEDQYTSETTVSEDGLTTTVVENLGTWNDELGDYDWTITTTVTQQVGELTVTTITVTTMTYDPETWQPIFDTTTETRVADAEVGDATYDLAEDTDLTPVQPSDEEDDQTLEESDPAEDETQTPTGGDQTYQPGADAQTTPVETAGDTAADDSDAAEVESETGAVSAASAGLLSLAWRTNGTGPGISLALARPVSSLRVTGILDTGQLFGSQRDGPLGILPSRSTLPTVAALLANRRIRT